jgi:hypothetical protein
MTIVARIIKNHDDDSDSDKIHKQPRALVKIIASLILGARKLIKLTVTFSLKR